jgi:FkbM family methyltransferase
MARAARRLIGKIIPRTARSRYRARRRGKVLRRSSGRRVFVDCGANTCAVLRSFVEELPEDFEFFAFEAQPELRSVGRRVAAEIGQARVEFIPKAVWTDDGVIDFYLATRWGPNYRGGSTVVAGHTKNESSIDYGKPVQVEAFDFSGWLRANFDSEDYVIVKMDIEGAEYDVLEKVVRDGNLPLIDELIVEFHQHMNDNITMERHDRLLRLLKAADCRLELWH